MGNMRKDLSYLWYWSGATPSSSNSYAIDKSKWNSDLRLWTRTPFRLTQMNQGKERDIFHIQKLLPEDKEE